MYCILYTVYFKVIFAKIMSLIIELSKLLLFVTILMNNSAITITTTLVIINISIYYTGKTLVNICYTILLLLMLLLRIMLTLPLLYTEFTNDNCFSNSAF